jgi:hypothetical protein
LVALIRRRFSAPPFAALSVPLSAALFVALLVLGAGALAACGSGSATPTADPLCDHWCGNASASVTLGGQVYNINGGGCYDRGPDGVDVRIGDWQGLQGPSTYLGLTGWRPGTTRGPIATAPGQGVGGAGNPDGDVVAGSIEGAPFILGQDTVVTFTSQNAGTFSGTDVNGGYRVTGTFTCG